MAKDKELEKKIDGMEMEAGEFSTFAREDAEDRKVLRISAWGAVAVHVLILLINFPALTAQPREVDTKDKKVFVVRTPKFRQPPPPPENPVVREEVVRVPMPDPTPDEPEPVRTDDPPTKLDLDIDTKISIVIPAAPPAEDPAGPIPVGGDVQAPVKTFAPQPQYTEIARKARVQGAVIVQATIDKQGNVTNVKILKSLPMGLGEEAVKAVERWKFTAATLNGKPVEVYYNLTVHFRLQ